MTIHEILKTLVGKDRQNKLTRHDYKGHTFYSVFLERPGGTVLPQRYVRKKLDAPLVVIFKTNKKGTVYQWVELMGHEIHAKKSKYGNTDEIIVDDSALMDFDEFNEEQANALVSGTYYAQHKKYLDVYSVDDIIYCIYRDKFTGFRCRKTITGFDWYFYVDKGDYNKMVEVLSETSHDRFITRHEPEGHFTKVFCKNYSSTEYTKTKNADPSYVIKDKLKDRVKTYEADVSLSERYMIDEHLHVDTDVRVLYFDIETDDSTMQIDMDVNPILSIGAVDGDGKTFFKASSDEKKLLWWWYRVCKDYDIYVGYNSYHFDAPYIQTRGRLYNSHWGPSFKPWRAGHVDMMKRIKGSFGKFTGLRSFSLENVSQYFLGKGKVHHEEKIIDMFKTDKAKLKKYNLMDCLLLKELDEKLGITRLMVAMCGWTGCFPTIFKPTQSISGISVSKMLDIFILRHAKDKGIHYPTAYWEDRKGEKYEGGYVMEPVPGLYSDVCVFDFKSLYPTIIWSWNISPENVRRDRRTKEQLIESSNGIYFYKDREAIFPTLVEELMQARKEYRKIMNGYTEGSTEYTSYDVMQQVAKELTNSLYGAMGQRGNRYFDFDVAGSVTASGRFLLKGVREIVDGMGMKVIYGDTDSVFVTNMGDRKPEELCVELTKMLKVKIQEQFNIDSSIIELEYEKKYDRFISVAAKNYAGIKDGKKEPEIKGLDCVKKSTIDRAKREQEELLYDLLNTEKVTGFYLDKMDKMKKHFYNNDPDLKDIIQKTSMSKHPSDIKALQPHHRVALQLIEQKREFYVGMQIPYIITDKKNKGVIHADDYAGEFDRDHYWDRIYTPLKRVLGACFPTVDWNQFGKLKKKRTTKKTGTTKKKTTKTVEKKPMKDEPNIVKKGFRIRKKKSGFKIKIKKTKFNQLFDGV